MALPPSARLAVIAGGGDLPLELAQAAATGGTAPLIVRLAGETDRSFAGCETVDLALEQLGDLPALLRRFGCTHVVLAGSVTRRPRIRDIRFRWTMVPVAFRVWRALKLGDDGLLKVVVGEFSRLGFGVVSVADLLPSAIVSTGPLTRRAATDGEVATARVALDAARAIGALDAGQAAIAVGGRVVALEGAEGTASMIGRVAELRQAGRLPAGRGGVLAKCPKPNQERRADLPAIGPETVEAAAAAGLDGIALEAEGVIVVSMRDTIDRADALGLFIIGMRP